MTMSPFNILSKPYLCSGLAFRTSKSFLKSSAVLKMVNFYLTDTLKNVYVNNEDIHSSHQKILTIFL